MYALFYAGYLVFGGIGWIAAGAAGVNALRKREEQHITNMEEANTAGYWSGFSNAWPVAYRQGERSMLEVCQAMASESIDMVGANQETQSLFNQIVGSWPQHALPEEPTQSYPYPWNT